MEKHDFKPKMVVVLCDNKFIYDALMDNISCKAELIIEDYHDRLDRMGKVDVLIVDKKWFKPDIPIFRINILINCTGDKISANEIDFIKPFRLDDLIDIIEKNQEDTSLFCSINKEWVYSQRLGTLSSIDRCIALTDKENELFKKLLTIDEHIAEKNYLLRTVWNYHQSAESNTVETHLYKLKQKLPPGLLEIKNSSCLLVIDDLK